MVRLVNNGEKYLEQGIKSVLNQVDNFDLPNIPGKYSIGLIIYKAHSDNVRFCASNKLFEYLACGLDVRLPKQVLCALEYVGENARPSVLALDFEKLTDYEEGYLFRSERLPERDTNYFCEPIYEDFYHQLIEKA